MNLPYRILLGMGIVTACLAIGLVVGIGLLCIVHYTPNGWEPLALAVIFIVVFGTWIGLREEDL